MISESDQDLVASLIASTWATMLDEGVLVRPDHCILGARLAIEAATYFSLPHPRPLACDLLVANAEGMKQIRQGVAVADWPESAHSVGVRAEPGETRIGPIAYNGHVVAETDHHLLDLAAHQFERPAKDIFMRAWAVNKADTLRNESGQWCMTNDNGTLLVISPNDDKTFRRTRDWRINHGVLAGVLIRRIREQLE